MAKTTRRYYVCTPLHAQSLAWGPIAGPFGTREEAEDEEVRLSHLPLGMTPDLMSSSCVLTHSDLKRDFGWSDSGIRRWLHDVRIDEDLARKQLWRDGGF